MQTRPCAPYDLGRLVRVGRGHNFAGVETFARGLNDVARQVVAAGLGEGDLARVGSTGASSRTRPESKTGKEGALVDIRGQNRKPGWRGRML